MFPLGKCTLRLSSSTTALSLLALISIYGASCSNAIAQATKSVAPARPVPAARPAPMSRPVTPSAAGRPTGMANRPATTMGRVPTNSSARFPTTSPRMAPGSTRMTPGSRGMTPGMTGRTGNFGGMSGRPMTTRGGFSGRPAPVGDHEVHTVNGSMLRIRPNGQRSDVFDTRRSMDIHHNLDGNRRVFVERADHSRIFAERGGRGFVQHPYVFRAHEFDHRTYVEHGRMYDRYYGRYSYRGASLNVYTPARYYPAGFYGWAYHPWSTPVTYSWGWGSAPWYSAYGGYFAPSPVYPSASLWLTDYLIGNTLQEAYDDQAADSQSAESQFADRQAAPPPPSGSTPILTPEIKAMVAEEVSRQVALENAEAQANAQKQDIDPAGSSIARMLSDNQVHVFVVGSDLDLVTTPDGKECPVSPGSVLQVASTPAGNANSAIAIVLSSKSWRGECRTTTAVTVTFTDLQEMQNHMRATIDSGMGDLQAKQGQDGLPAAPPSARAAAIPAAVAASAPPPDANAVAEITQQAQAADLAEQEAASANASGPSDPGAPAQTAPPAAASTASTTTITLGQTIQQITATLGTPKRIVDLGTKKVYIYPDMKITFKADKVSDVE